MLDEFSQFLFNQNSIAGWQYQNWMLVIGLPIVIFFTYLSQRGFHWRSATAGPNENPNESPRPSIPAVQKILGRTYFLVGSCFSTPSASAFHCSAVCSNMRLLCGSFVFAAISAHLDALTR